MAKYIGGSLTRDLECDITFTDGGGNWKTEGSAYLSGFSVNWTTVWADYSGTPPSGGSPGDPGFPSEEDPVLPGEGDPPGGGRMVTVMLNLGGLGYTDSTTTQTWTAYDPAVLTGTLSISIPSRELVDVGNIAAIMSGSLVLEPERFWAAKSRYYRNGTASVSATMFGITKSGTKANDSSALLPVWTLRSYAYVEAGVAAGAGTQSITASTLPTTGGTGATASTITRSGHDTSLGRDYTYSATGAGDEGSVSADVSLTATTGHPRITAIGYSSVSPERTAGFDGAIYRWQALLGNPVQYRMRDGQAWQSSATGDISDTFSQKNCDTYGEVYDHTVPSTGLSVDRHRTADGSEWFKPMALFTLGSTTYFPSLGIHGTQWDVINLLKDDTETIDDGSTLSPSSTKWAGAWTGLTGGSVAIVSGAVQVTGSGGKGVQRTFTGTGSFQGYSRIRIRLMCSAAAHSITLTIGGKTWAVTTGAAATLTNLYIDLGGEGNGPSADIGSPTSYYNAPAAGTLKLTGLGAGTYDIDETELLTAPDGIGGNNHPRINIHPGTGRKFVATTDALETLDMSIATGTSTWRTIASAVTLLDAAGTYGWDATDLAPAGTIPAEPLDMAYLFKSNHPAWLMGGDGLIWDSSVPSWTTSYTADARGVYAPGDLPAQWVVYESSWDWPEAEMAGFLSGGLLGCGAVVGGSLWGRVLETTNGQTSGDDTAPVGLDPASGVSVTLLDGAGATLATDTTESDGWFCFGALAVPNFIGRLVVAGRDGWVEASTTDRRRVVVTRSDPPDGTLLAMACSDTGRVVRGYKDGSNYLILEWWMRGLDWDSVTTTLTLTGGGALSYDRKGALQRLWLDYEDSGAINSRYTDDEGGTFSVATTIASAGTYPAITHSPTSVAHHYWVDGTAIKTKALDSQGNELVASSTVVASGVAASPIAAVHDGETILLTYKNGSGAVITVLSTDGGVTFS